MCCRVQTHLLISRIIRQPPGQFSTLQQPNHSQNKILNTLRNYRAPENWSQAIVPTKFLTTPPLPHPCRMVKNVDLGVKLLGSTPAP